MTAAEWDDLARLAEAATPGPWGVTKHGVNLNGDGDWRGWTIPVSKPANAEFIAAANPATILRLIEENRNLRTTVDADLEYQRRLEARLAAVEALADRWRHCGDPGDPRRQAASALRAALSAAPTDTTKEN